MPWTLFLAALSVLQLGCGGEAIVEGAREGDPAGAVAACAEFCDRRASDGCAPTSAPCETWCPEIAGYIGPCSDVYRDLLECHAAAGRDDGCGSSGCTDLDEALHACFYPAGPCGTDDCGVIDGRKVCDVYCSNGSIYESSCTFAVTPVTCTCAFDGQTLGTCEMTAQYEPNCCVQYFALSK